MADLLDVGSKVIVDPVDKERDPYIFQFQRAGTISSYAPQGAGFMIRLHSAAGEWGPVPAERLKVDKSAWRPGGAH